MKLALLFLLVFLTSCTGTMDDKDFVDNPSMELFELVRTNGKLSEALSLLERGADPNFVNTFTESRADSTMELAVTHRNSDYLELLLNHGGNPNFLENGTSTTIIFEAILSSNHDAVTLLIEAGANVHASSSTGKTPLHLAIAIKQYELATYLLDNGADPTQMNNIGKDARATFPRFGSFGVPKDEVYWKAILAEKLNQ